jgi:hypothetical protein
LQVAPLPTTPLQYDLGNVKAPVIMLSGTADVLAAPEDVAMQVCARERVRVCIHGVCRACLGTSGQVVGSCRGLIEWLQQ